MKQRHVYAFLAFVGLVIPYSFFFTFLAGYGLNGREFLRQLLGTPISTFFAVDLLLASVVFLRFLRQEAVRHSIENRWIYVVALFAVGLSFSLPLFLYARERRLESAGPES